MLKGREVHWAGALGRGEQSIRTVPEIDFVVVVTARDTTRTTARVLFKCNPAFSGTSYGDFVSGLNWQRRAAALDWSAYGIKLPD